MEELTARLEQRKKDLNSQRQVASATTVVIGGVLDLEDAEDLADALEALNDGEAPIRLEQLRRDLGF